MNSVKLNKSAYQSFIKLSTLSDMITERIKDSTYFLLVDISQEDTLLSVFCYIQRVLPILSLH